MGHLPFQYHLSALSFLNSGRVALAVLQVLKGRLPNSSFSVDENGLENRWVGNRCPVSQWVGKSLG